ncbi:MAG: gliding motility-associated C-terminal domain-containing protein [Chitinophagales bacterium]|nr:gliding motility-associated C-terminal domain-containing protein [Chitinophagales bacterium]
MKYIFYILIILLGCHEAVAQITAPYTSNAPDLKCVKNASSNQISLQWDAPSNKGACFLQYGIYMSKDDKAGPYVKIDSIASSFSGTKIIDPQYNGIGYFFIINEQSCPNAGNTQILTSDTLDNIVPHPAPTIRKVTVENNVPVLYWLPSSNPEVSAYGIYSVTNNYNTPIDTVNGRISSKYLDTLHNPTDSVAVYKMRSIEFCEDSAGLFSNITSAYNTMMLTSSEEDLCRRAVTLEWNGYNNQSNGVLGYRIDYSTDAGNTFQEKSTLKDTIRKFDFVGLTPKVSTCIRVVALLPNGEESWSNIICIYSQGEVPSDHHYIQNVTVLSDHVEIEYMADPKADIGELVLERSSMGEQFSVLNSGVSVQGGGSGKPFIIKDYSGLTGRTALYYKVSIKDNCSNKFSTLPVKTILLKGKNLGLDNALEWDSTFIDKDKIIEYQLYRIIGNDTVKINSQNAQGAFVDKGVYANDQFSEACYFIQAEHINTDTSRASISFFSNSNTVCLQPIPQAFVPNAFAPNGYNKIFKPIIVFGSQENYSLEVYNRSGKKVFESTDANIGWDGKVNGIVSALDSYIYHLKFKGMDGRDYQKSGFVVLVQ